MLDETRKNLDVALMELITSQTFSLDAVKAIDLMKTELAELKIAHEEDLLRLEEMAVDKRLLNGSINKLQASVQFFEDNEQDLKAREKKMLHLEVQAEFAELRRIDTRELALSMTRNIALRENVTGNVPMMNSMPDGSQFSSSVSVDTTNSKEQV